MEEQTITETHQIETGNQGEEVWSDEELMSFDPENEIQEEEEKSEQVEEEETKEGETEAETEEEEKPVYYSDEEINKLDPFEVDPEKLPDSARLLHRKYIDIFRQQVLPELQQLRAFRQKVENDIRSAQARVNPREAFNNEVRARALKELGVEEINELNSEHLVEMSRQAALLTQEISDRSRMEREQQQKQVQIKEIHQRLMEDFQDFDALDVFAKEELGNLSYSQAEKVKQDLMSGEYGRMKSVFDMFSQRKKNKNKPPAVKQKVAEPPKVISGSTSSKEVKSVDLREWSGASADDQAKMLLESGLLD